MSVEYDAAKENWWLSVGHSTVGDTHRSLTNKLMRDTWVACQVLENARVNTLMARGTWIPVEVFISKNGEPFGRVDVI